MANRRGPLNVGVLMGGTSAEREVSLKSGKAVAEALLRLGHHVVPVDIMSETGKELDDKTIDVAFVALHGRFGEDGRIQKILQERSIPFTGSGPDASRLAIDKIGSKFRFLQRGLETPPHCVIMKGEPALRLEQSARALGYPVVIKPRSEGSSIGVTVHQDRSTLAAGAETCFSYESIGLMEKFIRGRELTVGILDNRPLPVIELCPKSGFFDYDAKYRDPETVYRVDPPISDKDKRRVQKAAREAHKALGCEGATRVDLILTTFCAIHVLEVNTIPGLTERSLLPMAARAAGLTFMELCDQLIDEAVGQRSDPYWTAAAML